eukprot:TRINITY_DN29709_c1_g1_i1.p1 TRINITY_DN29709_c1_g1~~TRINITY_DN29709_c1_g1_i1.p1  ORF type:complete len:808 (+),score=172.40 TRINITY_DN29709_c1_g1_i1:306-2729(+)
MRDGAAAGALLRLYRFARLRRQSRRRRAIATWARWALLLQLPPHPARRPQGRLPPAAAPAQPAPPQQQPQRSAAARKPIMRLAPEGSEGPAQEWRAAAAGAAYWRQRALSAEGSLRGALGRCSRFTREIAELEARAAALERERGAALEGQREAAARAAAMQQRAVRAELHALACCEGAARQGAEAHEREARRELTGIGGAAGRGAAAQPAAREADLTAGGAARADAAGSPRSASEPSLAAEPAALAAAYPALPRPSSAAEPPDGAACHAAGPSEGSSACAAALTTSGPAAPKAAPMAFSCSSAPAAAWPVPPPPVAAADVAHALLPAAPPAHYPEASTTPPPGQTAGANDLAGSTHGEGYRLEVWDLGWRSQESYSTSSSCASSGSTACSRMDQGGTAFVLPSQPSCVATHEGPFLHPQTGAAGALFASDGQGVTEVGGGGELPMWQTAAAAEAQLARVSAELAAALRARAEAEASSRAQLGRCIEERGHAERAAAALRNAERNLELEQQQRAAAEQHAALWEQRAGQLLEEEQRKQALMPPCLWRDGLQLKWKGRGGEGPVYALEGLPGAVALKMFTNPAGVHAEAAAAAAVRELRHPWEDHLVLPVEAYSVPCACGSHHCFAYPVYDGDLAAAARDIGLSVVDALEALRAVLRGALVLDRAGTAHGDVKTQNVLARWSNGGGLAHVALCDVGGSLVTTAWLPPDGFGSPPSHTTDIYCAVLVFIDAATGCRGPLPPSQRTADGVRAALQDLCLPPWVALGHKSAVVNEATRLAMAVLGRAPHERLNGAAVLPIVDGLLARLAPPP